MNVRLRTIPGVGLAGRDERGRRGIPDPDPAGDVAGCDTRTERIERHGAHVGVVPELAARATGIDIPQLRGLPERDREVGCRGSGDPGAGACIDHGTLGSPAYVTAGIHRGDVALRGYRQCQIADQRRTVRLAGQVGLRAGAIPARQREYPQRW